MPVLIHKGALVANTASAETLKGVNATQELLLQNKEASLEQLRGEVGQLRGALTAERQDSESRTATLRSAAGDELERTARELEAAREAEANASVLCESTGRAAAAANAARVEAERERDEARASLKDALDSSFVLEDKLKEARDDCVGLSSNIAGLAAELRNSVEAGRVAAREAEDEKRGLLSETANKIDVSVIFCGGPLPVLY